ncbi:MAG: hypothetical protein AAFU71_14215 [Cyanobacteria bacterium J06632_22]
MKSQLIEDFLNLPGIEGIALIDGLARAYVHGLPTHNAAAQQQLTEGIQQILETTPETLESFTFCFQQQLVCLHKVDRGMALMVMAKPNLSETYSKLIAQLTRFMRTDFDAVANALIAVAQPVFILEVGQAITTAMTSEGQNGLADYTGASQSGASTVLTPLTSASVDSDAEVEDCLAPATLGEIEAALNQLSVFTAQYLGKFIVANHWRNHQPNQTWITQFQVTTTGTITLTSHDSDVSVLTPSQLALVQTWVADFSQRCAKIIRDYPKLVRSQALDTRQWQLLFGSD